MALFLTVFFALYGSLHAYFFLRLRAAVSLGVLSTVLALCFLLVTVTAPVLVRILETTHLEAVARGLSFVGYTWMGFLFLFVSGSLLLDLWRLCCWAAGGILPWDLSALIPKAGFSFFLPASLALLSGLWGLFEARQVGVQEVEIQSPRVPPEISPFRIVQISDVHLGLIVREKRLQKILDVVRGCRPDMLVSTGDLVDGQIDDLASLVKGLSEIQPPFGKYAVTGNHEFYAGLDQALRFTRQAGFLVLHGESVQAARFLTVAGVDDPAGSRFGPRQGPGEGALLRTIEKDRFVLLLKHRPVFHPETLGLFDLQLSGHTHRGQVFPFHFVVKRFYPYIAGRYALSPRSSLYVSRGSGTWGPPMRIFSPPEVTLIRLVHGETPAVE